MNPFSQTCRSDLFGAYFYSRSHVSPPPQGPPRGEPCVGETGRCVSRMLIILWSETHFLGLVLKWGRPIEAPSGSNKCAVPSPSPPPASNAHPRCFIPEVNVKQVMAAPSVVKETRRCQSSSLWNGLMKLLPGHQSNPVSGGGTEMK